MARAYSGVLGCSAMCLVIVRGLVLDLETNHILTTGLVVFSAFALLGYCIGYAIQQAKREFSENCFDDEMASRSRAVASNRTDYGVR